MDETETRLFLQRVFLWWGPVARHGPNVDATQYYVQRWEGMSDEDRSPYDWGAYHLYEEERRQLTRRLMNHQ